MSGLAPIKVSLCSLALIRLFSLGDLWRKLRPHGEWKIRVRTGSTGESWYVWRNYQRFLFIHHPLLNEKILLIPADFMIQKPLILSIPKMNLWKLSFRDFQGEILEEWANFQNHSFRKQSTTSGPLMSARKKLFRSENWGTVSYGSKSSNDNRWGHASHPPISTGVFSKQHLNFRP